MAVLNPNRFLAYDVTNPQQPVLRASINFDGGLGEAGQLGASAFVINDGIDKLHFIDIRNTTNPFISTSRTITNLLATVMTGKDPLSNNSLLASAVLSGSVVIDVAASQPATLPLEVGPTRNLAGIGTYITARTSNRLYKRTSQTILKYDISQPESAYLMETIAMPDYNGDDIFIYDSPVDSNGPALFVPASQIGYRTFSL